MNQLITSFLIQNGDCCLRGIGKFTIERTKAVNDVASKKILPPEKIVTFVASDVAFSENLIDYISWKKGLPADQTMELLHQWVSETNQKLVNGFEVNFPSLGNLIKRDDEIYFENIADHLFIPVKAEKVIHENDAHKILVGDKETDSVQVNEWIHRDDASNYKWWIAALILFAVGVLILVFYFMSDGFGQHIHPETNPATYITK